MAGHVGAADIKMNYCKKRYEVQASDYQMGVLLLYNTRDTLTTAEVCWGGRARRPLVW
jgi:hypothetical protein